MALNTDTITDLRNELGQLESEHDRFVHSLEDIKGRIEAIRIVLSGVNTAVVVGPQKQPQTRSEWIRATLRRMDRIASPEEVAKEMVQTGFKYEGSEKLLAVVATDLHRMASSNNSPVQRLTRGRYQYRES